MYGYFILCPEDMNFIERSLYIFCYLDKNILMQFKRYQNLRPQATDLTLFLNRLYSF